MKELTNTTELPKFLLGDNTDFPDDIFVIHTQYPRFVINLKDDNVEWLEEFETSEKDDLEEATPGLIQEDSEFYDREMSRYES